MNFIVPCLLTVSMAFACNAQGTTPDAQSTIYRQLEERKLSRPVFRAASWTTDFDEAMAQGKQQDKLVFAYLTRSFVT